MKIGGFKIMMNKFYSIFLIGLFVFSCSKDTCKDIDRGVYIYPEKPDGITFLEALEFYKIPKDIVGCIYTDELFQTCLTYPEIRMIWTRNSLQQGFDYVEGICNGFGELLRRSDAYPVIVSAYKELNIEGNWGSWTDLEIGHYIINIINHELFLAQNEILKSLTKAQKLELFQLAIDNQKQKFELRVEYYGVAGMESSLAILSRIMYNDQYPPFMEEYSNRELLRVQVDLIKILDSDLVDMITNLSEEYLKTLKN
ncbi:MAG: hypothetical protein IPJ16_08865 [Bacteroidales bacterium]|nr:hypothetical protein [Bacteroidales bacterium]